jgi:hypothetical protein
MAACGNQTYCCGADEANGACSCSTGKGTITIPDGVFQTAISLSGSIQTQTAIPSTSTKHTSTLSSTTTSSTSSPTQSAKTAVTKSKAFIIGIAVAAVVVLVAILSGTFWFNHRRRSKESSVEYYENRPAFAPGPSPQISNLDMVVSPEIANPPDNVRYYEDPKNPVITIEA